MSVANEDQILELAQKRYELLSEVLLVAEEQTRFCFDNDFEVYSEFINHRNQLVEKVKKTDVLLQRYLKQTQPSEKFNAELGVINGNATETIRKILAMDEINQNNLKQAMEMVCEKKFSLKANKHGVVGYYKTGSYPAAGVHTDSKG